MKITRNKFFASVLVTAATLTGAGALPASATEPIRATVEVGDGKVAVWKDGIGNAVVPVIFTCGKRLQYQMNLGVAQTISGEKYVAGDYSSHGECTGEEQVEFITVTSYGQPGSNPKGFQAGDAYARIKFTTAYDDVTLEKSISLAKE